MIHVNRRISISLAALNAMAEIEADTEPLDPFFALLVFCSIG
jgi:hypothetical protein